MATELDELREQQQPRLLPCERRRRRCDRFAQQHHRALARGRVDDGDGEGSLRTSTAATADTEGQGIGEARVARVVGTGPRRRQQTGTLEAFVCLFDLRGRQQRIVVGAESERASEQQGDEHGHRLRRSFAHEPSAVQRCVTAVASSPSPRRDHVAVVVVEQVSRQPLYQLENAVQPDGLLARIAS